MRDRERDRDSVVNAARHQTLEPRLHYPDQVVGRHRVEHILIEERNHLARATSVMRFVPRRQCSHLLILLLLRLLRDRIHLLLLLGDILSRG